MEVILLERVAKLGQMGDVVRVKEGFARNFLLPKGKALRATDENRAKFDSMKSHLQERNLELKGDAQTVASRLDGRASSFCEASETGHLFGSVSTRDLATILSDGGFTVNRNQVALNAPIKTVGLHKVPVALHPEIEVTITINIARSADEAERIARGEDVTARGRDEEESAEAVVAAAEAFFENPDDAEKRLSGGDAEEEVPAGEPAPAKS